MLLLRCVIRLAALLPRRLLKRLAEQDHKPDDGGAHKRMPESGHMVQAVHVPAEHLQDAARRHRADRHQHAGIIHIVPRCERADLVHAEQARQDEEHEEEEEAEHEQMGMERLQHRIVRKAVQLGELSEKNTC